MPKAPKIPSQNFRDIQYQFTQYLRDPEHAKSPENIEPRRLKIYRDLFYNNIESFISSCFPVLKSLLDENSWHAMVRDFMIHHHSASPLFNEIAHEFLHYLNDTRDLSNDPVFIQSLCHYEWVELVLSLSEAEPVTIEFDSTHDYLSDHLSCSPLAWPLSYAFPVHRISPQFQPMEAGEPVFLLVYRDAEDNVLFIELNPASARLLDLINSEGKTGYQAAKQVSNELQHPDQDIVIEGARHSINDWIQRGILIGND